MYKIIRFYDNGRRKLLDTGLTLEEAQKHCEQPNTQGITSSGVKWFDGYTKM